MVWVFLLIFLLSVWLLFKDTMNRLQYIQFLRIYWITRDTGVLGTPVLSRGLMRQTSAPFWVGEGIQVRYRTYTFQFGVLKHKSTGLLDQLGGRDMDESPEDIRGWK